MNQNFKNMIGKKFNRLTVLEYAGTNKFKNAMWKCKCDCGNEITISGVYLRNSSIMSCGCLRLDKLNEHRTFTHHMTKTRQFTIWQHIKVRCTDKTSEYYKNYGGRGIKICDRWLHSFENFWEDMQEGYSDNLSIDRIDNNGNYEKSNCKWSTMKEQANNRRNNRVIEFNQCKHNLCEWSEILGISRGTLQRRLDRGWNVEEAFTTKPSLNNKRFKRL